MMPGGMDAACQDIPTHAAGVQNERNIVLYQRDGYAYAVVIRWRVLVSGRVRDSMGG